MHPSLTHSRESAFTLIEMLISIAIVALLIGLLIPALSHARESGRASVCASNLRQLHLANDLYAQDHADRFAPGAADMLANLNRWHGARSSPGEAFTPEGGALTPYLDDSTPARVSSLAVRSCPSAVLSAGFERSAGGYGYNNAFVGADRSPSPGADPSSQLWHLNTDRLGAPRSRFQDPVRTISLADAALAVGAAGADGQGLIEYSFAEPRFWPDFGPPARPDPSIHFRHGQKDGSTRAGTASVAWLDGHISRERRTLAIGSGLYPADPELLGTGWFGADDDNSLFDYR